MACLIIVLAGCASSNKNVEGSPAKQSESKQPEAKGNDYPVGMEFGDWSDTNDQGITNVRNAFSSDEAISLGMDLPEKFGVKSITINIYKSDNGQLLDSWDDDVDPDWESFVYEFYDPESDELLETGKYEVAVFRDTTRIAEGTFNIK